MTAVFERPATAPTARAELVTKDNWQEFARCKEEPGTFVIVEDDDGKEPPYPTAAQTTCCQLCPARELCLGSALDRNEPAGVWGGMTTFQRELLKRVRSRKSCPGCGAHDLYEDNAGTRVFEVCIACGISWLA